MCHNKMKLCVNYPSPMPGNSLHGLKPCSQLATSSGQKKAGFQFFNFFCFFGHARKDSYGVYTFLEVSQDMCVFGLSLRWCARTPDSMGLSGLNSSAYKLDNHVSGKYIIHGW